MKTLKWFAVVVHMICCFATMIAGIIAINKLVPNEDFAWIIFVLIGSTCSALILTFFVTTPEWFDTLNELKEERAKYYEKNRELRDIKMFYLDKLEKLDERNIPKL